MKREAGFYSEGAKIAADVYLPDAADAREEGAKLPCVVLCHGFAGIREVILPKYAERFAREGLAALAFDYRGFGGSEGARGRLVPREQIVDVRNAITFAESLPEVDAARVGLWGTSFGGANAIEAAAVDERARCVVAQLAFGNGRRLITGDMPEEQRAKLLRMLAKARARAVVRNKPSMMSPEQILTDDESKAFYAKLVEEHPAVKTKLPMLTLQEVIEYAPEDAVGKIAPRGVMIVAAELDGVCPPSESRSLFEKAGEPKELVILEGSRHYETYEGANFEKSAAAAVRWFGQHLR